MTYFSKSFAASTRAEGATIEHRGRVFSLQRSDARVGLISAYLEVILEGEVVGYLTEYADNESGAVRANMLGLGAPRIFATVEDALDNIAPATVS